MTAVPTYIKRTSDRYLRRLGNGERIMRTAAGKIQWSSGGKISRKTVDWMLQEGMIAPLDCDLFGNPHRGQTIGLPA